MHKGAHERCTQAPTRRRRAPASPRPHRTPLFLLTPFEKSGTVAILFGAISHVHARVSPAIGCCVGLDRVCGAKTSPWRPPGCPRGVGEALLHGPGTRTTSSCARYTSQNPSLNGLSPLPRPQTLHFRPFDHLDGRIEGYIGPESRQLPLRNVPRTPRRPGVGPVCRPRSPKPLGEGDIEPLGAPQARRSGRDGTWDVPG